MWTNKEGFSSTPLVFLFIQNRLFLDLGATVYTVKHIVLELAHLKCQPILGQVKWPLPHFCTHCMLLWLQWNRFDTQEQLIVWKTQQCISVILSCGSQISLVMFLLKSICLNSSVPNCRKLILKLHLVLHLTSTANLTLSCTPWFLLLFLFFSTHPLPHVMLRTSPPCLGLQRGCAAPGWRRTRLGCPSSRAHKPAGVASEPRAGEPSRSQQPPVRRTQRRNYDEIFWCEIYFKIKMRKKTTMFINWLVFSINISCNSNNWDV